MIRWQEYVTKASERVPSWWAMVSPLICQLWPYFFLLTTRALSLSLFFMPFVLTLSPSVSLFYSSSICELFNSSTQEWEGEGRVVLAVQREGKKIMIERWFKLQDSKVPKSHTSKGIRAENHLGQSPIIQQQRTVTRFPDRCDFKVECIPPPKKKIGNIERNSEVSTKWTICARRAQPAHFLGTQIW